MTAIKALQSLLESLKEEQRRITNEISDITSRACVCVKSGGANIQRDPKSNPDPSSQKNRRHLIHGRLALMEYQKEIDTHIQAVAELIETKNVNYSNFPIFYNIELATRLASCGKVDYQTDKVASF